MSISPPTASSSSSSSPSSPSPEDDSFQSLLHDTQGRTLFKNYLKNGHSEHHLTFWEVVQEYRKMEGGEEERNQRAQEVYGEFIANGTKSQINITELQRMRVKEALEKPTSTIFDEAERTALELIKGNFYSNFLKTRECEEWQASKNAGLESMMKKRKSNTSSACNIL